MKVKVTDLLQGISNGSIVLPDFQRSFIWEPEDVRELLVSVLGKYVIGSMLILDDIIDKKDDSRFAIRLIEGVDKVYKNARTQSAVRILLDGQQRATALFYALYEPNLPLKGRKNPHKFYLDLKKALKEEWDEAVIPVNIRDNNNFTGTKQNTDIIPFKIFTNLKELTNKFKDHKEFDRIYELANDFMQSEITVIDLPRETSLEKIVETFERINRTGEPLSLFELLTARLYNQKVELRKLLEKAENNYSFVEYVSPEFILRAIALLRRKNLKRKNLLELKAKNFEEDWEKACNALEDAYKRTTDIKDGYGVLDFKKWMPYTTMLVPLAAMINFIKTNNMETNGNYDKLNHWYWTSVFYNRYDKSADSMSVSDFKEIKKWLEDDKLPEFINDPDSEVDLDIEKQNSATYRGVMSMIVLNGAQDFKTGQPPQFSKEKVQDDHIFPKDTYKYNGIANRTLISTNAKKWKKEPSEYFGQLRKEQGEEALIKTLKTHLISKDALNCLLENDLDGFIEQRKKSIRRKIGKFTSSKCRMS